MIGNLTEPEANSAIADYLNGIGVAWDANAERSQTLVGSGGRPDIVVRQHGRRAVVVENRKQGESLHEPDGRRLSNVER